MKQSISIFIVLVFLLPSASRVWIILDFKINQDYIAKVLCINKDKPSSGCNGKCHLKQQLQKTEDKEPNKTSKTIKHQLEINWYLPEHNLGLINTNFINTELKYSYQLKFIKSNFVSKLLRPPQFI